MQRSEPYRTRPIRFREHWNLDGFRMKVYGITYDGGVPSQALREAALRITTQRLLESAASTRHYGAGFVGIHQGRDGNFVFVDWWADENELHHHVYVSPKDNPGALEYRTPTGLAACVWDLHLIGFERDAWVDCVLKREPGPDLEAYLATTLDAHV